MKDQFVDQSGITAPRRFELCEVRFLEDDIEGAVPPDFDVVIVADDLLLKGAPN
jgi:hypothetical protein